MPNLTELAKETAAFCVACLSLSWEAKDIAAAGVPLAALIAMGRRLWADCPERMTEAAVAAVLRDIGTALPEARIDAVRAALAGLPSTARIDRETLVAAVRADGDLSNAIVAAVMAHLPPALDYDTRSLAETALATGFRVTRRTPGFRQHLNETLIIQAARDQGIMLEALGRIEGVTQGTRDDLREMRGLMGRQFEALMENLGRASREQMILLADRFEIAGAEDLTETALRRELEKRAEDWRALRAQVEAIPEGLRQLSNLKGAAQAAFVGGRFDEVEELLERVHEVELEEAAKTAELRADTALLRGRVDQAFGLLSAAADSFAGIDPLEPPRRRILRYFSVLRDHGLRYGGAGIRRSLDVLAPVLTDELRARDAWLWAAGKNALGNALSDFGERTGGAEGAGLLGQAVAAYRAALEVRTRADHPVQWAMTQNNLGTALQAQGARTGGAEGAGLLGQAVAAYRAALEVRTRADHPVDWAMTQENLALVHESLADHDTCIDPAPHLRDALFHVEAALEVFDPVHMPYNHQKATTFRDHILARLAAL